MNKKTVSVIVPFFNEEASLPYFIEAINQLVPTLTFNLEVVFVNDGSSDNSVQVIKSNNKLFAAKLVTLSKNFGSHAAARAGLKSASGDACMFFSADLQDPPEMINRLFTELEQGNDIVAAQRKTTSVSFFEKVFSRFYSWSIKKYAVKNYPAKGVDLVIFNSKVKEHLNENIEANSSIFLQILSLGFKIRFIEYTKLDRKFGKSKWTFSKKIKLLIDSFVAFSFFPMRLVSIVGILFFITGLFWTIYIVARKLIYDDLTTGWPMLTSILLLGFGITNISLGIIAEYLWRTLDASRKRPVFIIDEIIEL